MERKTNMSVSETIRKMNEMKLFGMARSLDERQKTPDGNLNAEEYLGLLVDDEYLYRKNNRLKRLLQNAKLRIPEACLEEIDYRHPRGLVKSEILRLQTTEWITSSRNVLLTGPTGVGKSYLACALGQWACRQGYSTLYQRWPRLLGDLYASRGEGAYLKRLERLSRVKVLVIDDFGLHALNDQERKDFLEIIEDRHMTNATVFTSQLPIKDWYEHIGDPTIADAILDRLLHVAYKIELKGDSMRTRKEKVRSEKD
jgi:DNA replication protein DnaC